MDTQSLINTGIGVVIAIGGWLGRELWEAVKMLRADLHRIEVDLPSNYLRRDEFSEGMKEIRDLFAKVFDKLDGKVDK
jgi:aspartate aminotransferase-like enzyme